MLQLLKSIIYRVLGWNKWSIVMQKLIDIATQHLVSHLLYNIWPNVILANAPNISFCAPWHLLCQISIA